VEKRNCFARLELGPSALLLLICPTAIIIRLCIINLLVQDGHNADNDSLFHTVYPMFFAISDQYADGIKNAFSTPIFSSFSFTEDQISGFGSLFRSFYQTQDYTFRIGGQSFYGIHMAPPWPYAYILNTAVLIKILGPVSIHHLQICIDVLLVALFFYVAKYGTFNPRSFIIELLTVLSSYPLLWVFDRNNNGALISAIFVAFYCTSLVSKKHYILRLIYLSVAVSFRPNNLLFLILEVLPHKSIPVLVKRIFHFLMIFLAINIPILYFCHFIDPLYTIKSFLRAYRWYNEFMFSDLNASQWSTSFISHAYGFLSSFIAHDYQMSSQLIFIFSVLLLFIYFMFFYKGISFDQYFNSVILVAAVNAISTPIYSIYHLTIFSILLVYYFGDSRSTYIRKLPLVPFVFRMFFLYVFLLSLTIFVEPLTSNSLPLFYIYQFAAVIIGLCAAFKFAPFAKDSNYYYSILVIVLAILPTGSSYGQGVNSFLLLSSFIVLSLTSTMRTGGDFEYA
jgi:hypothetical protein